ncbi:MAG: hypothetical protein WC828_07395 [Thermoleophilia bacterium]|jgi:hypothetical protein
MIYGMSMWRAMAALCIAAPLALLLSGCAEEPVVVTSEKPNTSTAPVYKRQQLENFRGMAEPRGDSWEDMVRDAARLKTDGFNTAMISPPVLISQRAGGKPRVGLEGAAGSAPGNIEDLHRAGMAVFLAPTTTMTGFTPQVESTDTTLGHLNEDTIRWATTAEQTQSELFSPLSQINLALGTEAAGRWSAQILPQIREIYHGNIVAMVVPDLAGPPTMGAPHDFERLNYTGYDYLMVDIFPVEDPFNQERFEIQVNDVIVRAIAVAQRDGLKGVMIQFGAWRGAAGADTVTGPQLGEEGQAKVTGRVLEIASPQKFTQVKGVFFQGWTLPGRGAKDYAVEQTLKNALGQMSKTAP